MTNFRRSKKIGALKINLSKSGFGVSTGVKGLRIGVDSKGRTYGSAGIPGTGIYSRKTLGGTINNQDENNFQSVDLLGFSYPVEDYRESDSLGCLKIIAWIVSICLIPAIIGIFTTIGLIIYTIGKNRNPKNIFKKQFTNAIIKAQVGDFEKAITILKKIEAFDPKNVYLIDLEGVCLFKLGKYEQALTYFERLNNTERTTILLSETLRKIDSPDNYPRIIELNKSYLNNHPLDSETNFLTAYYLYKMKKYKEAISFLQNIMEEDVLFVQSLNLIACSFSEMNEIENAIQTLQKAPLRKQNLDDDLILTHYTLGCLYQEKNDKKNALKHLQKVILNDINYKDASDRIKEINVL